MSEIERRALMKGAALSALAFTAGGAEVLLSPKQARAQNIPFRTLTPEQVATLEALGETLVPGAKQAGISHFVDQQLSVRLARRCWKRASSISARLMRISIAPRSARSTKPAKRPKTAAALPHSATTSGTPSSTLMRQNKVDGWQGPPGPFVYLVMRSDAVDVVYGTMDGYAALGIPYMPHIAPTRGGDMANAKVDAVIVGAGASGTLYASVLAKAGKKVVLLEAGPDWQLTDLISSDFWGRRVKPAGIPFLLEGKNPYGYAYQAGWGVGGAALHYFANFPRYLPNDFKVKSEHNRGLDWPISYADVAPYYDKVAAELGVSGDAKAEEIWRPKGAAYPMPPMKTFRNGDVWKKGCEAAGIRMVPAAVGMNSTEFKGRPACIYDGWCHVGCPIGALANPLVTYLADAKKAGAEVRAFSTVTRVLTNAAGTRSPASNITTPKRKNRCRRRAWSSSPPGPRKTRA